MMGVVDDVENKTTGKYPGLKPRDAIAKGTQNMNESAKRRIWAKATTVGGYDPSRIRKDAAGAWIVYDCFMKEGDSTFAWEIEHIVPRELVDGAWDYDDEMNLRPAHRINAAKRDGRFPDYIAGVVANGAKNKLKESVRTITRADNDLVAAALAEVRRRDAVKAMEFERAEQNRPWVAKVLGKIFQ